MLQFGVTVLTLLLTLVGWLLWRSRARPVKGLTGPGKFYPYLGNMLEYIRNQDRYYDWSLESSLKHNKTWLLSAPVEPPAIITCDSRNIEHILQTNFDNYEKGEAFRSFLLELLGDGIFNVDGKQWRKQRKVASHLFSMNSLAHIMSRAFVSHGETLVQTIAKFTDAASPTQWFDLHDIFFRYTMDSFAEIAFGMRTDSLHDPCAGVLSNARTANGMSPSSLNPPGFGHYFDRTQELLTRRFFNPFWRVERFLNVGAERELAQCVDFVQRWSAKAVAGRRQPAGPAAGASSPAPSTSSASSAGSSASAGPGPSPAASSSSSTPSPSPPHTAESDPDSSSSTSSQHTAPDLLALFLRARDDEGRAFSDRYLQDALLNFLLAGRDSTAVTLAWTFYELTQHPEVLRKVCEEIDDVLGSVVTGNAITPDFQLVRQLVYLHAVVLETLRLHPAVGSDGKYAIKDDVLPSGAFVPAGAAVVYEPYSVNRLPDLWPEPLVFDPERWLFPHAADEASAALAEEGGDARSEAVGSSGVARSLWGLPLNRPAVASSTSARTFRGSARDPTPFEFPVFNAGPRTCLGKTQALIETKIATAMLLQRFLPVLKPGHPVHYKLSLTLGMKHGLVVRMQPRQPCVSS